MPKGPITWTDDDCMAEIERLTGAMKYTGTELGKAREEIERLESRLRDRQNALDHAIDYGHRMDDKIERMRAALERIEVRGIEIISEHVGGSDASYVAQELTAIAREALNKGEDK